MCKTADRVVKSRKINRKLYSKRREIQRKEKNRNFMHKLNQKRFNKNNDK